MPERDLQEAREPEEASALGLSKKQRVSLAVVAPVAAVGLVLWELLGSWTPEQWSASAAVATAVVALVAAFVGLRQLREAQILRRHQERDALALRREQAQPYVAVFDDPLVAVDPKFHELVIKNFGATAAYNIRIESEPTMERWWQGEAREVRLPEIPTLVPGQEWRVLWDFFPNRHDARLPDRHVVTVQFEDSHGQPFTLTYVLDWGINRDRLSVETFGVHHGVKELKKVREQLAAFVRSRS